LPSPDVVKKQEEMGVDIVSEGEMSKISYATYIRHRLTGFEVADIPRTPPKDLDDYPEYKDRLARMGSTPKFHRPICRGAIAVRDLAPLHKDIANLNAAMAAHGVTSGFMNAPSPGVIAVFQPNQFYKTHEEYIGALADAMRAE
jgi:5-methyltetrahydropteroyltriglutamate--homocysteine methyltransferase